MSPFEFHLRTGRLLRPVGPKLELKFNPWHDTADGRFTFVGQGRFFAGSGGGNPKQRRHLLAVAAASAAEVPVAVGAATAAEVAAAEVPATDGMATVAAAVGSSRE